MVDFKLYDRSRRKIAPTVDNQKAAELRIQKVKDELDKAKNDKFYLGVALIDLYHNGSYGVHMGCDGSSKAFFIFCEGHFDLKKSFVSRCMNVVSEFGDKYERLDEPWNEYSWSALVELLPLTRQQRQRFNSNTPVSEIRAYKKSLRDKEKAVATSQQEENDVVDTQKEPERFQKYSRLELISYVEKLEKAVRDALAYEEIDEEIYELLFDDKLDESA